MIDAGHTAINGRSISLLRVKEAHVVRFELYGREHAAAENAPLYRLVIDGQESAVAPLYAFMKDHGAGQFIINTMGPEFWSVAECREWIAEQATEWDLYRSAVRDWDDLDERGHDRWHYQQPLQGW